MFALVDANSFYASAEKVFDPSIRQRPVVVLTNNDGCICAMCDYAKQLGIKKFGPYYQVKDLLRANGAVIRSSNYELYDDLSNKMMEIVGRFAPRQHVYSIDECFLDFGNWSPQEGWANYAIKIKDAVARELRLPVSVGISLTPTLAKVASFVAKKRKNGRGAAVLISSEICTRVLNQMRVEDIWGIGKRLALRLSAMNIDNAGALAACCPRAMRQQFSVEIERTIRELNGTFCFDWTSLPADKKQTFSTRAFGSPVTDEVALRQSLAWHAERVSEKLRLQQGMVRVLTVFAHANPFASSGHYHRSVQHSFACPVNDASSLVRVVSEAVSQIFQPDVKFHKSGVGALDICSQHEVQPDFFDSRQTKPELMQCMDLINRRYGKNTMGVAAKGLNVEWTMKRDYLSPQFTTNWRDIPKVLC